MAFCEHDDKPLCSMEVVNLLMSLASFIFPRKARAQWSMVHCFNSDILLLLGVKQTLDTSAVICYVD
jgi:hypothetical protein